MGHEEVEVQPLKGGSASKKRPPILLGAAPGFKLLRVSSVTLGVPVCDKQWCFFTFCYETNGSRKPNVMRCAYVAPFCSFCRFSGKCAGSQRLCLMPCIS